MSPLRTLLNGSEMEYTDFVFSITNSAAFQARFYPRFAVSDDANEKESADAPISVPPEWPAHFPQACPPANAADLNRVLFLLVASNPPTMEDAKCAMDRKSHQNKPPCQRAALSCWESAEKTEELRDSVPRMRDFLVASAKLEPQHGKTQQTGRPGHYSVWLRSTFLALVPELFVVLQ